LARAINDRGDVVVDSDAGDYLWRNGKLTRLGFSLSGSSDPLNERGQVIGITRKHGLDYAAVWDKGRIAVLGSLARRCRTDYGQSDPVAINERGQIIGMSATDIRDDDGNCVEHAFLWQNGKMRDLGVLPEELHDTVYPPKSEAWDINEKGEVVGLSQTRRKNTENPWPLAGHHAVLWRKGRIIDLASLGPNRYDLRLDSAAAAINERGAVVGYSYTGKSSFNHASLWQRGKVIDLLPRGKSGSQADAISEGGLVLGFDFGRSDAFVWQNGNAAYLGMLVSGTGGTHAEDLNNKNQVVGNSVAEPRKNAHCEDPDGQAYACRHAVLWTMKRG
jgi:probable HAF family extracellular repeat protein